MNKSLKNKHRVPIEIIEHSLGVKMSVSGNNGNFNLFGMNVHLPTRTIKQVKDTAAKHLGDLVSPIFDYLEDNQKVFTGEITDELNKYNAQLYRYGQVMRKGATKSGFSIDA